MGAGRAAFLKEEDKCICDCTICNHIPLEDFLFFVFEWKTTSKSQLKINSIVKLHLPNHQRKWLTHFFRIHLLFPSLLQWLFETSHYIQTHSKQTFGWIHQPSHHTQTLKVSTTLFLLFFSCPNYEEESKWPSNVYMKPFWFSQNAQKT